MSRQYDANDAHHDVAAAIAERLTPNDPLRAVLAQTSLAYGSVAGAIESYLGASLRDQDTTQQRRELVNAIHAPTNEAEQIAGELCVLARDVGHQRTAL